jgi:hypothetical protein
VRWDCDTSSVIENGEMSKREGLTLIDSVYCRTKNEGSLHPLRFEGERQCGFAMADSQCDIAYAIHTMSETHSV